MSSPAKNKHGYNDGQAERYALECPEGGQKGRLKKIGDAISKRMKEKNPMHIMSEEQLKLRAEKIHEYNMNRTEEQKRHKSEAISKANKGKLKGNIPWNKGKKGIQEAWNKGLKMGPAWNKGLKMSREACEKLSGSLKNRIPWNKNLKTGPGSEETKEIRLNKQYETKKQNKSFNISAPEIRYGDYLIEKYGKENVITQYKDDRYPFACDFYIKSLDLFIELNLTGTHGNHPFDNTDDEDLRLLERWKEKAQTSDYYKNAIYTWTDLDIRKQKTAKENNLNYKVIYNMEELYD